MRARRRHDATEKMLREPASFVARAVELVLATLVVVALVHIVPLVAVVAAVMVVLVAAVVVVASDKGKGSMPRVC